MRISFSVEGEKLVDRRLLRFEHAAEDMRPAFDRIHTYLLGVEKRQFNSEGAASTEVWAPLKPSTIARKAARGHDPRIMRATGRLFGSLTSQTHRDHAWDADKDSFFFGTKVPYAAPHQRPKPSNTLPRRQLVALKESQRRRIAKIIQEHMIADGKAKASLSNEST